MRNHNELEPMNRIPEANLDLLSRSVCTHLDTMADRGSNEMCLSGSSIFSANLGFSATHAALNSQNLETITSGPGARVQTSRNN